MHDSNCPKIAFIGWNPFQLLHVKNLIKELPGSCFILENKKDFFNDFDESSLTDPTIPVLVWDAARIGELDGVFDIIVCQTPFSQIHAIKNTRIAMIQYGYAKEAHNYGAWRSLADLNLTYGEYATKKISHFSNAVSCGNPRYDDWHSPKFHLSARDRYGHVLNTDRKTLLFAPTWSDLSSIDQFFDSVCDLADGYNVLVKMHHNTDLLESGRRRELSRKKVHLFGANDDLLALLSISDVLISDYSGAIFDGIYCQRPVVLLNSPIQEQMGRKLDEYSIEYLRRDELGVQVRHPSLLPDVLKEVLDNTAAILKHVEPVRRELFVLENGSTKRAVEALLAMADGNFCISQQYSYVRSTVLELFEMRAAVAARA